MPREKWVLEMLAEPIVPAWRSESPTNTNGAELQTAILRGFGNKDNGEAVWSNDHKEFTFTKEFTDKEHGEFFRGALTMAGIRYSGDFYDLLKRYGKIKVTICKVKKIEE